MKRYKGLFKISMVVTSLGLVFMTMMIFIVLVYAKDIEDVMRDPFSRLFLQWPMWFVLSIAFYIPGISGLIYATKLKNKAKEEAMKIL